MVEVQDIFQLYGSSYLVNHRPPPHVQKAARTIRDCRTSVLGGHSDSCDECGYVKLSYNSCRNRHCPKCQGLSKERWIMDREADLLPIPYFHVVFTLPEELNRIAFSNQEYIYNLLFKTSSETLRELAADTKYLGAEIGLTSILHTWGQNLTLHPHVHMIVPGGGLVENCSFRQSSKKFFIPVKVMSKKFRGKFLFYLKQAKQELKLQISDDEHWQDLLNNLYEKDWYVYCKRPFKTTSSVIEYLGRYTHRVAISNHRILSLQDGTITFKWRDYRDNSKEKIMSLTSDEFIRRFLLHVLPQKFTKIRHYGLLASTSKKKKLTLCKSLTGAKLSVKVKLSTVELMIKLTGRDISLCPCCGIGHFTSMSGLAPPQI